MKRSLLIANCFMVISELYRNCICTEAEITFWFFLLLRGVEPH